MSSGSPDPPPPSRLREFWNRRSWIGKTALVVAALLVLLIIIGIAVPPTEDDDPPAEAVNQSEEPQEDTPTEEAAEGEAATDEAETTAEEAAPPPPPPRVARVIDGDTLKLASGRTIRLVQIDAPERNECYSRQATATLRRLVPPGTEVRLVRDLRLDNRDRFGRLLRYVFKGRRNVNVVLVRRGAASVWFFQGDRGRHAARLTSAADQARANRRGAWGDCEASYDFLAAWTTSKKPPPQPVVTAQPASDCHPSYKGACLDPSASDYDCAGGEGNGPEYTGLVRVVGSDEYGLDADGDGIGCEDS